MAAELQHQKAVEEARLALEEFNRLEAERVEQARLDKERLDEEIRLANEKAAELAAKAELERLLETVR